MIMSYLWQPNNPGTGVTGANNSSNYLYDIYPYYNFMDRTDYNITDKLKFFARYSYLHTTETTSDYTGTGSVMRYFQGSTRNAVNASGDLVWTINPTTVFDIHTAYNGINDSFASPSTVFGVGRVAKLWPNNWYASYAATNPQVYFPNINITAGRCLNFMSSVLTYWIQTPQTPSVAAKLSKAIGRHYLRFGGEFRKEDSGRATADFHAIHVRRGHDCQYLQLAQYGASAATAGPRSCWAPWITLRPPTPRGREHSVSAPQVHVFGILCAGRFQGQLAADAESGPARGVQRAAGGYSIPIESRARPDDSHPGTVGRQRSGNAGGGYRVADLHPDLQRGLDLHGFQPPRQLGSAESVVGAAYRHGFQV